MFYLILAVICNCGEAMAVRFSEKDLHNRYAVTMFNYIIAVAASYFFIGDHPVFSLAKAYHFPIALGVVNGVIFISWLLLFQISIRYNGPPLSATFTKLGVLLPTFGSIIFFAEKPGLVQISGIILALIAITLFNLPEKVNSPDNAEPKFKLLLVLLLVIGGAGDFNSKIFENFGEPGLANLFLFYTFGVALILSFCIWLVKNRSLNRRDVLFGVMIGIPNQLAAMLLLWSLMRLPAYVVFPVYSVGVILLVSLVNSLLFRERSSRRQRLSMAVVCLALICLNL